MKLRQKSWLTKGILTLIKKKRTLFKKFKKLKLKLGNTDVYRQYKLHRDTLKKVKGCTTKIISQGMLITQRKHGNE